MCCQTPLLLACQYGQFDCVRSLLQANAHTECVDSFGKVGA